MGFHSNSWYEEKTALILGSDALSALSMPGSALTAYTLIWPTWTFKFHSRNNLLWWRHRDVVAW